LVKKPKGILGVKTGMVASTLNCSFLPLALGTRRKTPILMKINIR
jgi:hypothetical protein